MNLSTASLPSAGDLTRDAQERCALERSLRQREYDGCIGNPRNAGVWSTPLAASVALAQLPAEGEFAARLFGVFRLGAGYVLRRYERDGLGVGAIDPRWADPEEARRQRDARRAAFMAERGLVEDAFGNFVRPEDLAARGLGADGRITKESDTLDGAVVYDAEGNEFRVHYQRGARVIAHPIVEGRPQVSRDTTVRFWVDPETPAAGDNDRTDPIYPDPEGRRA